MKILLFMPTLDGKIPEQMVQFLMGMQLPEGAQMQFMTTTRMLIHAARNLAIEKAIMGGFDYLWFLDDDNPPKHSNALSMLLECKSDISCGVVRLRNREEDLNICKAEITDKGMVSFKNIKNVKTKRDIIDIQNCGSACVLISRECMLDVREKFGPMPFENKLTAYVKTKEKTKLGGQYVEYHASLIQPENLVIEDGKMSMIKRQLSEDFLFFERAQELGYKIKCNTKLRCYHIGKNSLLDV